MCLPAVGQGALAIEARTEDTETRRLVDFLRDDAMADCGLAERSFLKTVEGGCQVPVGVYAVAEGEDMTVEAVIASLDGRERFRDILRGSRREAENLGKALADRLLDAGGIKILHEIGLLLDRC